MHENLESAILREAGALQRGDVRAIDGLVAALKRVAASDVGLAPILASLLARPETDAQVFAACALAKLGSGASAHVDSLVTLMNKHEFPGSCAAASALGCIPSPRAVEALTQALDTFPSYHLTYVASALQMHGAAAQTALRALDKKIRSTRGEHENYSLSEAAASIRLRAREENSVDVLKLDLFQYVPVSGYRQVHQSTAEFFAQFRPEGPIPERGLVVDDRFRYLTTCKSECGVRIYRLDGERAIVILSCDGGSYGMSPTNAIEGIATALLHMYDLNPEKTIWLERYARSSGRAEDECTFVHFAHDTETSALHSPAWRPLRDFVGYLRAEFGIEW